MTKGKGKQAVVMADPSRSRSPVKKTAPPTLQSRMRKGKGKGSKKSPDSDPE